MDNFNANLKEVNDLIDADIEYLKELEDPLVWEYFEDEE